MSRKACKPTRRSTEIDESTETIPRECKRQQKPSYYAFQDSPKRLDVLSTTTECQVSPICRQEERPNDQSRSYRPSAFNTPNAADQSVQHQPDGIGHNWENPREQKSATPYTWSDTEHSKEQFDSAVEAQLLGILHTGLPSTCGAKGNVSQKTKKYFNLEELKAMLESRKAGWDSEVSHTSLANTTPSGLDCRQSSVLNSPGTLGEIIRTDSSHPACPDPMSFGAALSHRGKHQADPSSESVDLDGLGTSPPSRLPTLSNVNHDVHIENADDDEAFFRALDATYNEIVNSDKRPESAGDHSELHDAQLRQSVLDKEQPLVSNAVHAPHQGSVQERLSGQDVTPSPRFTLLTHRRCPSQGHLPKTSGRHLGPPSLHGFPCIESPSEKKGTSILSDQPWQDPSLPTPFIDTSYTVPPGFWRQHRLY